MIKRIFTMLLLFFSLISLASSTPSKSPIPSWVKAIEISNYETIENQVGYQYLLIDLQDNIGKQALFRHYAVKILNSEGVQALSDISVSYDPSYQKLAFHKIEIIRDGERIEKLKTAQIQRIQRETNMERSLYDGSISAVINLTDVRDGDIINYSYSITGFNPVNKGNYSNTYYQQYTTPVNQLYTRIISNNAKPIYFKEFGEAVKPTITRLGNDTEYTWQLEALDSKLYDNNTPFWYDDQKRVSFSTFKNWNDVVNWALPLYATNTSNLLISRDDETVISKEDKILEAIRLVQDDVRYLGFESGIGAYKPNNPKKVLEQRYGDCKDKSLLLIALLKDQGITAFPVFVNSMMQDETGNLLPSNTAFDHCIVNVEFEDTQYFIDPTIANQGGNLEHLTLPNYKKGLRIKKGETSLVAIKSSVPSELFIEETITIDSIGGDAIFLIKSTYKGAKADYMRSYFNTNSKDVIQREFTDFYSNLYPEIEATGEVRFQDNDRAVENVVSVEEYYKVNQFWLDSDDATYQYCEVYPIVLESLIDFPQATAVNRKMPFRLGSVHKFEQISVLHLPENWPIEEVKNEVEGNGFVYKNHIQSKGQSVHIKHQYELSEEVISGTQLADFQKKHEEILNYLPYYLTYNESLADLSGFKLSWLSILIVLMAIALGVYGAYRIYHEYDPDPEPNSTGLNIGGWLVLPAIGLTISPFTMLYECLNESIYYNKNTWLNFLASDIEQKNTLVILFGSELFYNYLFLIFSILVVILFYQRRTAAPRLIIIFYAINFIGLLINTLSYHILTDITFSEADLDITYREIGKAFIGAIIWIPYFYVSERVKNTFVKTKKIVVPSL